MEAADGLLVIGDDGRVLVYNRPAEVLLGLPLGTLAIGTALREVAPLPGLMAAIDSHLHGSGAAHDHVVEIGPHQTVHAELVLLPRAGEPPSLLVLIRDMRDGERLQSMRRDFIANVSHEIRTPLAAIRACSATLLGGALDDQARARQFVTIIDQHAARLGQLVDDLACLGDLEGSDVALQRRSLDVGRAIDAAVRSRREQAANAGIAVRVSVAPDVPALDGDRDLFEQVLLRLIDNALRYTPSGGQVVLSAGPTPGPDGTGTAWVHLAVTDTGVGISAGDVSRLSERFYRPDKGRSRDLGGSGLGLALVKHIVRAHGALMEIASAPRQGTAVTIIWPPAEQPAIAVGG